MPRPNPSQDLTTCRVFVELQQAARATVPVAALSAVERPQLVVALRPKGETPLHWWEELPEPLDGDLGRQLHGLRRGFASRPLRRWGGGSSIFRPVVLRKLRVGLQEVAPALGLLLLLFVALAVLLLIKYINMDSVQYT